MVCNIFLISSGETLVPVTRQTIPLIKAVEETVHIKRDTGRRERYVKELERYLKMFARGREQTPVQDIDGGVIESWFTERREAVTARASNLGKLSAMFNVCWRRGYIPENPILKLDKPYIEQKPPDILTLRQIARALIWSKRECPELLAWLTMTLLVGVRPEEADKIKAQDIDLARGELRIDAAASKVRKRRIIPLSLAAVAWLRLAGKFWPLTKGARRGRMEQLRDELGFSKWPSDLLRHTAASYLLARHQDAGKVAMMLGNSASILHAHYKQLVPKEDGIRFCSLLPSPAMVKRVNESPKKRLPDL